MPWRRSLTRHGPRAWDRKVQESARNAEEPTALGNFRREFWAHMLHRHPSEGDPTKPYAASSRWHELPEHKLAVVQYIAKSGAGIFIRCPRGGDDEAAAELLNPYERKLEERLGAPMNASNPCYLFVNRRSSRSRPLTARTAALVIIRQGSTESSHSSNSVRPASLFKKPVAIGTTPTTAHRKSRARR